MTVSSNPFPIRYSGDGSSTTFPVSGYFLAELDGTAHLLVTVRDADGNETTKTQATDYTVGGAGNPLGGSITFVTPPSATETVVITRNVPDTQEVDYLANDAFPAESHERALDKLTMRLQQRANDLDRALLLGITDTDGSGAYEAGGNRIEGLGTPTADTDAATKAYVDTAVGSGGGGGGGGVTDHGALTGLADDDHTQYHNDARGDARYYLKAQTYTQTETDTLLAGKAGTSHTQAASTITFDDTGLEVITGADVDAAIDSIDAALLATRSTGLRYGGEVTGLGNASASVSAGVGTILDNSDPTDPHFQTVTWSADASVALSAGLNWIYINSAGSITVTTTEPGHDEYRSGIQLARVSVTGGVISGINSIAIPTQQLAPQIWDIFKAYGLVKSGMAPQSSGANLKVKLGAGEIYQAGVAIHDNPLNPHEKEFAVFDTAVSDNFRMATQTGTITTDVTDLPVTQYDVGGTVTAIPGSSARATIFTVFRFPAGNVRILYGQEYYADLATAEAAVTSYSPIIPTGYENAIIVGYIIATAACTSLADAANASFVETNRFGSTGGGVATSGGGTAWGDITGTLSNQTDLQTALDNAAKWDLPSLEVDYSGVGDGTTDNSSAVTTALAAGPFYVPDGTFDVASLAPTDLSGRFYGDGVILTSDNYKRGRYFSLVDAAPSSTSNRDSVQQAFHGDMSGVQFPVEHRITGAATMGQPTSGYSYRHECYPHFTYLRNESGHNQNTGNNDGRTGTCAYQTKVDQWGQGDAVAYNALVYIGSTKSGSTDFLANPAGVILNGSIIAGVDGCYLNTVEFDMQDNGYDCAGIGIVTNMNRTVGTGAKNAIWMGARYQSLGTTDVDAGISFSGSGGFKVGIDFTPATLDGAQPAIAMKSGQRIFLNSTAGTWYKASNGGESIYYNGSSVVIGAGNVGIVQARSSELDIAPSGSIRFRCDTSGATVASDFKVASSVGGSNYFRARSTEVNCSVQLKVNNILDIYNPTTKGSATAAGLYLKIRVNGSDYYVQLFN